MLHITLEVGIDNNINKQLTLKQLTMKKSILSLVVLFLVSSFSFAQEELKSPKLSGIGGVDAFASKSISVYKESNAITKLMNAVKVEKLESGAINVTDAEGKKVESKVALSKLDILAARIKKQTGNLKKLVSLKDDAAKALKGAKMMKKAKGTKTLNGSVKLEKAAIDATKTQGETLTKYIGFLS